MFSLPKKALSQNYFKDWAAVIFADFFVESTLSYFVSASLLLKFIMKVCSRHLPLVIMQKAFFHEAIFVDVNGCLDKRQTPPFSSLTPAPERFKKRVLI